MNFRYQVHKYLRSQYLDIPEVIAGFHYIDDAEKFIHKKEENPCSEGYLRLVDTYNKKDSTG